jgi:predicted DNA-binding transcriptional regulator AlpA
MHMKTKRPSVSGQGVVDDQQQQDDLTTTHDRLTTLAIKLLWDSDDLVLLTGVAVRTRQKEISAGRFPQPTKRVGRRVFWLPSVVRQWVAGGGE